MSPHRVPTSPDVRLLGVSSSYLHTMRSHLGGGQRNTLSACLQSRNRSRGAQVMPLSGSTPAGPRPACSWHVSPRTVPLLRARGGGEHSENNGLLIGKITGSLPIGSKTMGHILGYTNPGEQTTSRSSVWGERRAVFSENRFSSDFCLLSPRF